MFNLSLYQYEIELIHSCISCIYSNIQKKVATITVAAFILCAGHGTNSVGDSPTTGSYRQV